MYPLISALKRGDLIDIEQLITEEIDVDKQDEQGVTALQFAAQNGYTDVVKALLIAGADPNIKNKVIKSEFKSSTFSDNINSEEDKNLVLDKMLQELQGLGCITALHIAVKFKQLKVMNLLLEYDADPNIIDTGNCTPLHWAAAKGFNEGVELLLANKADPNIQDLAKSTALHEAVRKKHVTIIRVLLEKNANPNLADVSGDTACSLAKEDPELQDILLTHSKYLPEGWLSH